MLDMTLVQIAINSALDVCWPMLHPDVLAQLQYV